MRTLDILLRNPHNTGRAVDSVVTATLAGGKLHRLVNTGNAKPRRSVGVAAGAISAHRPLHAQM